MISARKLPTACTRLIRSATVMGAPVTELTVVVSEVMNGSMCRRRSNEFSDAMSGSTAARYRPKCASLVARLLTVLTVQVARLRAR